jgi:hypothetical protein
MKNKETFGCNILFINEAEGTLRRVQKPKTARRRTFLLFALYCEKD